MLFPLFIHKEFNHFIILASVPSPPFPFLSITQTPSCSYWYGNLFLPFKDLCPLKLIPDIPHYALLGSPPRFHLLHRACMNTVPRVSCKTSYNQRLNHMFHCCLFDSFWGILSLGITDLFSTQLHSTPSKINSHHSCLHKLSKCRFGCSAVGFLAGQLSQSCSGFACRHSLSVDSGEWHATYDKFLFFQESTLQLLNRSKRIF